MSCFSACYIPNVVGNQLILPTRKNNRDFLGELRKRRGEREKSVPINSKGILRLRARTEKKRGMWKDVLD